MEIISSLKVLLKRKSNLIINQLIEDDSLIFKIFEKFYLTEDLEKDYILIKMISFLFEIENINLQNFFYENFLLIDIFIWKI